MYSAKETRTLLTKYIFEIFSPVNVKIEAASTANIDTELIIKLPTDSKAFVISKFKGQKVEQIDGPAKKRIWITLLNESYFEQHIIKKIVYWISCH